MAYMEAETHWNYYGAVESGDDDNDADQIILSRYATRTVLYYEVLLQDER